MPVLGAALLALVAALPDSHATGVVVDPQGRSVPRARVSIACADRRMQESTDDRGEFALSLDGRDCVVTVVADGFAPYASTVPRDRGDRWVIHLDIARLSERVEVVGARTPGVLPAWTAFDRSDLDRPSLDRVGATVPDWTQFAKSQAGAVARDDATYVDGVRTTRLPPAALVKAITVEPNEFSAEFGDAGANHVAVTTMPPERRFAIGASSSSPPRGGRNPLRPDADASQSNLLLHATIPVPHLPAIFFVQGSGSAERAVQPFEGTAPAWRPGSDVLTQSPVLERPATRSDRTLYAAAFVQTSHASRVSVVFDGGDTRADDAGAGGTISVDAATQMRSRWRSAKGAFNVDGARFQLDVTAGNEATSTVQRGDADSATIAVGGEFVGSAPPIVDRAQAFERAFATAVVTSRAATHPWRAGLTIARTASSLMMAPNTHGLYYFDSSSALADATAQASSAILFLKQGRTDARFAQLETSAFVQRDFVASSRWYVSAGARLDGQQRDGVRLAPRTLVATRLGRFSLGAGAGLFSANWATDMLVAGPWATGQQLRSSIVRDASLDRPDLSRAESVVEGVSPGLTRRRDAVLSAWVGREVGPIDVSVTGTWNRASHLAGAMRLPVPGGWLDLLESQHRAAGRQARARLHYRARVLDLAATYQIVDARDDGDGGGSFATDADNLGADWGRATGVPRRNLDVAAMLQLPLQASLSAIFMSRSASPYTQTVASDISHTALLRDRAGWGRNASDGPAFQSLTLVASRRFTLPAFVTRILGPSTPYVGMRLDNALDTINYAAFGSVAGTPLAGRPVAALPGRSVVLWVTM